MLLTLLVMITALSPYNYNPYYLLYKNSYLIMFTLPHRVPNIDILYLLSAITNCYWLLFISYFDLIYNQRTTCCVVKVDYFSKGEFMYC